MAVSPHVYITNNIYRTLANRLRDRHKINIAQHIDTLQSVGTNLGVGITFKPVDSDKLKSLLRMPAFAHDNRRHLCDRVAALATTGEGYREVGAPSLHIAISPARCNIHLDSFGFVAIGPDGKKYYNPDLVQHIVDELGWATISNWLDKHKPFKGQLFGRMHPILPNSRNRYNLAVGGRFVLAKGRKWSLGIDHTHSVKGERKTTGSFEVLNW